MTKDVSGTARRYLSLWLPFLATDRLRHARESTGSNAQHEAPLVLTEKVKGALRLAAVDPSALALGLTPGMTLADARARIPKLVVAPHDPMANGILLERLCDSCARWTPLVALDPPDGLILDTTGCAHLFGGEAALQADMARRLERAGLTFRMAHAGTPQAARALARFGPARLISPDEEERIVRALPIAALATSPETITALRRAGLKTIDDLAERPSAALAARFGEDLTVQIDRVLGREDARITPRRPEPDCLVQLIFAEPIARQEDVEGALAELTVQAAGLLERRGAGGRLFEARFFRADGAVRRISVEAGRPLRDPRTIQRLYRERFEAISDPVDPGFGFDLIQLAVPVLEPLSTEQASLDGRAVEEQEIAALVDRLVARFGPQRVQRFAACDTHDPDRAASLVPAADSLPHPASWPAPEPGEPPSRPLHIFDPPQPIEAIAEVPDGPPLRFRWRRASHDIIRVEGPERIAPEWWRGATGAARDYYRVEDRQGRRFWLFRVGLYGRESKHPPWFLHGLFA